MENLIFGFLTGGSLILVIEPQNIFVIEQGFSGVYGFYRPTNSQHSDTLTNQTYK